MTSTITYAVEDGTEPKYLRSGTPEERREAAARLGSVPSEKRNDQARKNGALGGRPLADLSEVTCSCSGGDSLEHKTYCKRGRVIKYRRAKGLPPFDTPEE